MIEDTDNKISVADLKLEDVLKLYEGRNDGCRCGCLGTYVYAKAMQEEGGKDRGYRVDDDEVVPDSRIEEALERVRDGADRVASDLSEPYGAPCKVATRSGGYFNLPTDGGACLTVYLREGGRR